METVWEEAGADVKVAGIKEGCGVEGGGVGMTGGERGRGEGMEGSSPVVTCDGH